jgi:hypothetical protein
MSFLLTAISEFYRNHFCLSLLLWEEPQRPGGTHVWGKGKDTRVPSIGVPGLLHPRVQVARMDKKWQPQIKSRSTLEPGISCS